MYEPTDEQIEALAERAHYIDGGTIHAWESSKPNYLELFVPLVASREFRDILRAAQESADV